MGFNQSFRYCQAKSRAGWPASAGLSIQNAVELVEDPLKIGGWDAGTAIRHAYDNLRSLAMGAHINGRTLGCIAYGIFDQVGQNLVDHHIIQFDWRQVN